MTINPNSRYSVGTAIAVDNPDGTVTLGVLAGAPTEYTTFLHYTVAPLDRLDTIAFTFYGDATLWWVIAQANPGLFYPYPLVAGSVLAVPQL